MPKVTPVRGEAVQILPAGPSIIALDRFIQSTRDSGYRGTTSAIAELVDNALEASAQHIEIRVTKSSTDNEIEVAVLDDGIGMDVRTLTEALRFGGTTRFNSRTGLGRFGMGLPNASLSQARRVDVFSWQDGKASNTSYLDVDQIVGGTLTAIPKPTRRSPPSYSKSNRSGTLVLWTRCDRLDHRRIATIEKRLLAGLGRIFRHYLWSGVAITINGKNIEPIDPSFLRAPFGDGVAEQFHETITIEVAADADLQTKRSGNVKIVFTELPVAEWHQLSNDEKRARAITNGGGVSIVRGKREVDFGWFFMGTKRRESYDDWWRCEIRFDPALDDAFGISHTKQQIRPSENLVEALTPIIEDTAKALNSRARHKYLVLKTEKNYGEAEKIAARHHGRLRPISKRAGLARDTNLLADLANRNVRVRDALADDNVKPKYLIVPDDQVSEPFYKAVISDRLLVAVLNSNHLFYRKLYEPLVNQSALESGKMALIINLMLLSAIRAEASFNGRDERKLLAKFRKEWSDVFDALLRS